MEQRPNGFWHVSKMGQEVGIIGSDSSVVAVLPEPRTGPDLRIKEAYLIAAAPQLFEVCCKVKAILENNLIVTKDGFKITCSDIEKSLLDAVLRASGYRKNPDEP